MEINNEVKKKYREMINQGLHKEGGPDLNYHIAVSSGLPVSQEIPSEIYKRAAWASNQGASFVELYLGGPAQIYNDWDNLLSISKQLGLSFDAHFPLQTPFDYANPNRGQREQMGFFRSHEFMYEFIEAWGEFKKAIESQRDVNGNQQAVYGINAHLVKSRVPELRERMSSDVSVDVFGDPMTESRYFKKPQTRVGFFLDYLWEEELKDNFDMLQNIASDIEGFTDYREIFRTEIVNYMVEEGYITEKIMSDLSRLNDPEYLKDNMVKLLEDSDSREAVDISERELRQWMKEYDQEKDEYRFHDNIGPLSTDLKDEWKDKLDNKDPEMIFWKDLRDNEQEDFAEFKHRQQGGIIIQSAVRNIAGIDRDLPKIDANDKDDLKEALIGDRDGSSIAQSIPRFDPKKHLNARWSEYIPKSLWDISNKLTDVSDYHKAMDQITHNVKKNLKKTIVQKLKEKDKYEGPRQKEEEDRSVGEMMMRDILNFRGGYFRDQLNRESVIFWYILPWWMPFCGREQVKNIWNHINQDLKSSDYDINGEDFDINELKRYMEDLQRKRNDNFDRGDNEERKDHKYSEIVAAGAGAYVWGHFTKFIGRGQNKTLVEKLAEKNLTLDWEAHNTGNEGENKIWKPYDIIKVCEAINNTKIMGNTYEVMHCTIDAEHLAINGVDPLWVIDGNEERNHRGMEKNDGYMITKQHITHPALSEQQHHHQPIRRGDTYIYRQIYSLVEKGFCRRSDRPGIILYELGEEKAESVFMLRLMLNMIEMGIEPGDLEGENANRVWQKLETDEDLTLREYTILKFFGLTEEEWHHEWQEIFEHALDPLSGLLETTQPDHTWLGSAALERENQPDEWKKEEYR